MKKLLKAAILAGAIGASAANGFALDYKPEIDPKPVDSKATKEAVRLKKYLSEIYGTKMISGQMDLTWRDSVDMEEDYNEQEIAEYEEPPLPELPAEEPEPVPEPVPEPSPEPVPEPSPEPEPEPAPQPSQQPQESSSAPKPKPQPQPTGTPVDSSWFDDALFIGDSVTLKLSYYADYGSLGNAQFLCAGSLGYGNALWDLYREGNVHPVYNGTKYTVPDGVKMIQPAKIFIMLGMNDIGLYGVNDSIENMKILTSKVEAACPSAEIYIESVTPMLQESQLRDLNNTSIAEFDSRLKTVCAEKGYHYLDIASAVEDGNGNLIYDYCSDASAMGLHFSDAGCYQWVNYLKNHVNDQ